MIIMPLQLCMILLLVSTTQAFHTILRHRPKSNSLLASFSHHIMNRYATAVEDLQSINYQNQNIPNKQWDSLHRYVKKLYKGRVWTEPSTKYFEKIATDQGLRRNHLEQQQKLFDYNMWNTKHFKNPDDSRTKLISKTPLQKQHFQDYSPLDGAYVQPHLRIYYPSPPPQSLTGYPPPPPHFVEPITQPHVDKFGIENQPFSTDETFNRPTTHMLYPTWPDNSQYGRQEVFSDHVNGLVFSKSPSSFTELQNIPTIPSSKSTFSEQATGFPRGYFQPPQDVEVQILSPETNLDWSLAAPPQFTSEKLLEKLFTLRYSGMPIHLELGAETTGDQQTCVYLKKMLVQDPGEALEWTITITDNKGEILWEDKCLPDSSFIIRYGYHVVFNGEPLSSMTSEAQPMTSAAQSKLEVLQTEITTKALSNVDKIHDNSKVSNIIPVPRYLQRRAWARKSETDADHQYRLRSSIFNGRSR